MTRMNARARGLWLLVVGAGACLDRGSLGNYEDTGSGEGTSSGDSSGGQGPSTATSLTATSESSTSGSDDEGSSTGDPAPSALCMVSSPVEALAGFEIEPVPARVMGADGDELWSIVQTWDPKTEILALELTPHVVDVFGEATPMGQYGVLGRFERFADIDGDGADDLVVIEDDVPNWRTIGGGSVGLPQPLVLPENAYRGWFDADGDTIVDVFVLREIGGEGSEINLWRGDGSGSFTLHSSLTGAFDPLYAVTGVMRAQNGRLAVEASNEAIGFGLAWSAWEIEVTDEGMVPIGGTEVVEAGLGAAHDFDDDGRLDFVMGHIENETHLMHHTGDGYDDRVLTEFNGVVAVGAFLPAAPPLLFVAGGDEALLFEAPHDPTVAPITLLGDAVTVNAYGAVDVDGDGTMELLDDDYDFEAGVHRPAIVQFLPCE